MIGDRWWSVRSQEVEQLSVAATLAGEVQPIPFQQLRNPQLAIPPLHVLWVGGEPSRLPLEMCVEAVAAVCLLVESGATAGTAIDGEVNAGVTVLGSDDAVFNFIQTQPIPTDEMALLTEEGVKATSICDTRHRIALEDAVQHDGIVGVDPVRQGILGAAESLGCRSGAHQSQAVHVGIQGPSMAGQTGIVHPSFRIDSFLQDLVEQCM